MSKEEKDRGIDRGEPVGSETPEDVATLYSWANLHGAKYRDFSAPRREHRAQMRATQAAEAARTAEDAASQKSESGQAGAEHASQQVPPMSAEFSQAGSVEEEPRVTYVREYGTPAAPRAPELPRTGQAPPAYYPPAQGSSAYQDPYLAPPASYSAPVPTRQESQGRPQQLQHPMPAERQHQAPAAAQHPAQPQSPPQRMTAPSEWQYGEGTAAGPSTGPAFQETLQHSRERMASRWFALKGVFSHPQGGEPEATVVRSRENRPPVLAVFSLAGGVGKTSLVATLGRALASYGERSLLVDASPFGMLPYYFGSRDRRPGTVRTFTPPGGMADAPVHLLSLDGEAHDAENAKNRAQSEESFNEEITRAAVGMQRVVIDLTTASGPAVAQILRLASTVLVPVVPDLNSIVSLDALDNFFGQQTSVDGRRVQPYYLLNQFDPSLPLHLDVREVLRQQLGDRLLPTVVRRTPAVSEALAEGMTVIDYAANSQVAEDYLNIAAWLRNVSAPAAASLRGLRWSEK